MTDDLNRETNEISGKPNYGDEGIGKISGKSTNSDLETSRISGNRTYESEEAGKISGSPKISGKEAGKISGGGTIPGRGISEDEPEPPIHIKNNTRKERIAFSTSDKGIKSLPQNFGDSDGDWRVIEADNYFEILYLDANQASDITPEIVENNFQLLRKFWEERNNQWESGSGQARKFIEDKFGKSNLQGCLKKIDEAYNRLNSILKIKDYKKEYFDQRIKQGEIFLEPFLKMMLKDGVAESSEIESIFENGFKFDLTTDEISFIVKIAFDKSGLLPYGNPIGNEIKDQLLSVDWMTIDLVKKRKKDEEERGKEIFENKFAYNSEDIGSILYTDEGLAKEYIRDELVTDYFSIPKAKKIKEITKENKYSDHIKYLKIIYFLNTKLPYRFQKKEYYDLKSLSAAFFEEPIQGKEHFKQGNIEIWLEETQKDNYQKLIKIRDNADNFDLAFIELLYTFNPDLPYRFNESIIVTSPEELCIEINKNSENWNAGKKELENSFILIWLKTIDKKAIVLEWDKVKDQYLERKDEGIEFFLHLLNERLENPLLELNVKTFSYPQIQSGESVLSELVLSNKTRGFITGNLTFSKPIEGVTLSSNNFSLNVAEDRLNIKVDLKIESKELLKGVDYSTDILITTTNKKEIVIPVSFRIVFPKKAFINELIKYSILFGSFGLILRGIIYAFGFHNWLNTKYNYYLHPTDIFWQEKPTFYYFPIILLIFILLMLIISVFWKPIKRTLTVSIRLSTYYNFAC